MVAEAVRESRGFAEPLAGSAPGARRGRGPTRHDAESAGPALLFLLLVSAFLPSVLLDFNLVLPADALVLRGSEGGPRLLAQPAGELPGQEALCSSLCVADAAPERASSEGPLLLSLIGSGRGRASLPFRRPPGASGPRAPPIS